MMENLTLTTDEGSQIEPVSHKSTIIDIFNHPMFDEHLRVVVEKAKAQAQKEKNVTLLNTIYYYRKELKRHYLDIVEKESKLPAATRWCILTLVTTACESLIQYYKNKSKT